MSTLKQKIEQRSARVVVIGIGYVGLPLVVEFAGMNYLAPNRLFFQDLEMRLQLFAKLRQFHSATKVSKQEESARTKYACDLACEGFKGWVAVGRFDVENDVE